GLLPSGPAVQFTLALFTPAIATTESGLPGPACTSTVASAGSELRPAIEATSSKESDAGPAGATKLTFDPSGAASVKATCGPAVCRQAKLVAYWLCVPSSTTVVPVVRNGPSWLTEMRAIGLPGARNCVPIQLARS